MKKRSIALYLRPSSHDSTAATHPRSGNNCGSSTPRKIACLLIWGFDRHAIFLKTRSFGDAYIETQIHGDLTWGDVAQVVLDPAMRNLEQVKNDLADFKRRNPAYTFTIAVRPAKGSV